MTIKELLDNENAEEVDSIIHEVDDHGETLVSDIYSLDGKFYELTYRSHPEYGPTYEYEPIEVIPKEKIVKDWVRI